MKHMVLIWIRVWHCFPLHERLPRGSQFFFLVTLWVRLETNDNKILSHAVEVVGLFRALTVRASSSPCGCACQRPFCAFCAQIRDSSFRRGNDDDSGCCVQPLATRLLLYNDDDDDQPAHLAKHAVIVHGTPHHTTTQYSTTQGIRERLSTKRTKPSRCNRTDQRQRTIRTGIPNVENITLFS